MEQWEIELYVPSPAHPLLTHSHPVTDTPCFQSTSTDDSSISSGGAIGRQFNPEGSIGQMGEKIGGPLSKEGMIGSQFDASKGGIAGKVESMVGGPRKGGQSELGGTGYMDNLGTDTSGIPPGEDEAGGLSRTFKK